MDGEPYVRVTLDTIYAKLLDVEKKVDPLPREVQEHDVRIGALERRVWTAAGAASTFGAVVGGFGAFLMRSLGA